MIFFTKNPIKESNLFKFFFYYFWGGREGEGGGGGGLE